MSKLEIAPIQAGYRSAEALTQNFEAIAEALENTLSRDGTSPNEMGANLDMDSNRIINLPEPVSSSEPARLADLEAIDLTADDLQDLVDETEGYRDQAIAAMTTKADKDITITGQGLATGGGSLEANRTITETEASEVEAQTGTASNVVMTPRRVADHFDAFTTSYTRTLLDDTTAAAVRTTLQLGAFGVESYTPPGQSALDLTLYQTSNPYAAFVWRKEWTDVKASAAGSNAYRFVTNRYAFYNATCEADSDWYHVAGGGDSGLYYYGNTAAAQGSFVCSVNTLILANALYGATGSKVSGEPEGFNYTVAAVPNSNTAGLNIWGGEINVIGPTIGEPSFQANLVLTAQKFFDDGNPTPSWSVNGLTDRRGQYVLPIQVVPGIANFGPTVHTFDTTKGTYPLDIVLPITGYAGDMSGGSKATSGGDAGAREMARTLIALGGPARGPWSNGIHGTAGTPYARSKYGTGIDLQDYTTVGIKLSNNLGSGKAIVVGSSAGVVEIGTNAYFGGTISPLSGSTNANLALNGKGNGSVVMTSDTLTLAVRGVSGFSYVEVAPGGASDVGLAVLTRGANWGSLATTGGLTLLSWNHNGGSGGLSFFGGTPVAKQTVAAAASDPATTQTLANDLRAALIAFNLAV